MKVAEHFFSLPTETGEQILRRLKDTSTLECCFSNRIFLWVFAISKACSVRLHSFTLLNYFKSDFHMFLFLSSKTNSYYKTILANVRLGVNILFFCFFVFFFFCFSLPVCFTFSLPYTITSPLLFLQGNIFSLFQLILPFYQALGLIPIINSTRES